MINFFFMSCFFAIMYVNPSFASRSDCFYNVHDASRRLEVQKKLLEFPLIEERISRVNKWLNFKPGYMKIESASDIPFVHSEKLRPPEMVSNMSNFVSSLDDSLQKMVVDSYNSLIDHKRLRIYFADLFYDTALWMKRKGRPADLQLLSEGRVNERVLVNVIISRIKNLEGNNFINIYGKDSTPLSGRLKINNDGVELSDKHDKFRVVAGAGPFIDNFFGETTWSGHGVYSHLLQRDIVNSLALPRDNGERGRFWKFFGTRQGVALWVDLFDSGDIFHGGKNFTRPEGVVRFITEQMGHRSLNNLK